MVDEFTPDAGSAAPDTTDGTRPRGRRRAASRPAGPPVEAPAAPGEAAGTPADSGAGAPAADAPAAEGSAKPARRSSRRAAGAAASDPAPAESVHDGSEEESDPASKPARKATRRPSAKAAKATAEAVPEESGFQESGFQESGFQESEPQESGTPAQVFAAPLFQAPDLAAAPVDDASDEDSGEEDSSLQEPRARRGRRRAAGKTRGGATEGDGPRADEPAGGEELSDAAESEGGEPADEESDDTDDGGRRRRRRRGGRRRRRGGEDGDAESAEGDDEQEGEDSSDDEDAESGNVRRRRRRRRRGSGDDGEGSADDPPGTITRVREPRTKGDDVAGLRGSTRLEAKKQRRREGREAGRRRAPILTEAEFLARRESVERVMVVRQSGDRTQIAVLEDGVLVEHYVTRGSSGSMVGNVYLGRVQNVLPSMEAAFVDIGRGRNAVLYAGEVNWDAAGLEGQPKRIEFALKSGDPVLVQVTKDPVGQKGARLTSQISLPGRFLVYVPEGNMTGISRKLPENERARLKKTLKRVVPEDAGVIVRTAAEGAPEEALESDVRRLTSQWADIKAVAESASPPALLYSEPDLAIKVVRDIFNEDVTSLVVSGDGVWTALSSYISGVAPDLVDRLSLWVEPKDVFASYRVEEQLMKALDRKVHLPSGGSLVIDRTEAMTVVDVNTGKFTGQGGNLEQTVTRNNLEAAEEIVRQLRLRDIGGIIVVDFIDMVLESNRDLVLRRLVECLGRDRTKHQVAEVTSLGLVQMTRKRIGSGLLESFSETCEHCGGRGLRVSLDHAHESPKSRKPAGFVDPAEAAARALAATESDEVVIEDPDAHVAEAAGAPEEPQEPHGQEEGSV